jgi:enhancing lycopene biosynthesis protein 2
MAKRIAVILSGCGYLDGAEIHEAVCALLAIERAGASYRAFAPDMAQLDVVDHVKQAAASEKRNALVEAARIARGAIQPLGKLRMAEFDGVVLPGGYGAAKNLVNYAVKGADCDIDPEVERVLKEAHALRKPIGAMCIAPVVVARALGAAVHPTLTIGTDAGTAADIRKLGGTHADRSPVEIAVDEANRIVSTPCYMSATRVSEVFEGATKLVEKVLAMAG